MPDYKMLLERLERKELYRPQEWQLRNPDGPEAAAAITSLSHAEYTEAANSARQVLSDHVGEEG